MSVVSYTEWLCIVLKQTYVHTAHLRPSFLPLEHKHTHTHAYAHTHTDTWNEMLQWPTFPCISLSSLWLMSVEYNETAVMLAESAWLFKQVRRSGNNVGIKEVMLPFSPALLWFFPGQLESSQPSVWLLVPPECRDRDTVKAAVIHTGADGGAESWRWIIIKLKIWFIMRNTVAQNVQKTLLL